MKPEFSGIERRLDELVERLARLKALKEKSRAEFDADAYLRDAAERNLEIAAQCCIDICHRIIALEGAQKPRDYYEAITRMGEMGVLPADFAIEFAPVTGLRNALVHEYMGLDWDEIYKRLQSTDDFARFADHIRTWLSKKI